MKLADIYIKALRLEHLSLSEGVFLFENAPTAELMAIGNQLRFLQKPEPIVTWIIDRNVNTTNVCVANCKFCNFYRKPGHEEVYITDINTYKRKIEETIEFGGDHRPLALLFTLDFHLDHLDQLAP